MPPSQHNTAQKLALSPQMRSWVDNCLVPILVREYVAELERKKFACSEGEPVAEFAATDAITADIEGGR